MVVLKGENEIKKPCQARFRFHQTYADCRDSNSFNELNPTIIGSIISVVGKSAAGIIEPF